VKYIATVLLALALLAVPSLAFEPSIPVATIEAQKETMQADYGSYSFSRIAVDAGPTNTWRTSPAYTPQYVYSGMLFGADEKNTFDTDDADTLPNDAYTAGVLANVIKTRATYGTQTIPNPLYNPITNPNVPQTITVPKDGVGTDTTRQYVNQGGKIWLTTAPIGSDAENQVDWSVDMGFEKTNLAWMSSKMDQFIVDAASQGAVGGNFLQAVPNELSPKCQNVWLTERECGDQNGLQGPISVAAWGDADLKEAFAGSRSTADLKMYPADVDSDASVKMSGYAERFAGYTNADVAGNFPAQGTTPGWDTNAITMDLGSGTIENFWNAGEGVEFDAPTCSDFPKAFPSFGYITWPDEDPSTVLP
jgi:hypothetical protein